MSSLHDERIDVTIALVLGQRRSAGDCRAALAMTGYTFVTFRTGHREEHADVSISLVLGPCQSLGDCLAALAMTRYTLAKTRYPPRNDKLLLRYDGILARIDG